MSQDITVGQLRGVLQDMLTRAADLRVPFNAIGPLMVSSSVKNFQAGGRPTAWAPNAPSTARKKAKAGRTKILIWSGALYRSITFTAGSQTLTWGTNLPYGRIHQEGGTITHPSGEGKVRLRTNAKGGLLRNERGGAIFAKGSHKRAVERAFTHDAYPITIPARPFLVLQPEDRVLAQSIISRWVLEGRI